VGRLADINGFAEFLAALPTIFAAHPTLRATVVGGVPNTPRTERRWKKRWEKLAGDMASRLRWTGWLSQSEVSAEYANASMIVVPSWFETFGQVAREAMLHGVPLITTGAGGLSEIANAETALLIERGSHLAIASAVDDLLADLPATQQRRARALERVAHDQHWNDRVAAFRQLYKGIMNH